MRLKQGLIKPTELRTAPGVFEERHATWLELFYDLAFVAVISQISHGLSSHFDLNGVMTACVLYIPVWWAWVGQAFYLSRFDSDDMSHRLLALVQIVLAAFMAVSVSMAFEGNQDYFAACYAAVRGVLILEYLIAGAQIKKARRLTTRYALGFGIASILWVVSIFADPSLQFALWGVALVIDFVTPLTNVQESLDIPPDYSHIPERFGLFTIIVLGEAILAAVSGMHLEGTSNASQVIGPLGLVLAFALWWMYFDGVKGHQVQIPKYRKDARRMMTWMYSHLILSIGIVVTAVGIKKAMLAHAGSSMTWTHAAILTLGLSAVMVGMHTIYWAGLNPKLVKIAIMLGLPHWITSLAIVSSLVFCAIVPAYILIFWMASLCVLHVLWTLRELPEMEDLLKKVESAKKQTANSI